MRKLLFTFLALLCMSAAVPTYAQMTPAQKDECLLASRNCSDAVDDIQMKIKKISNEIEKGTAVYTPEELKKLQQKLAEVRDLLSNMEKR